MTTSNQNLTVESTSIETPNVAVGTPEELGLITPPPAPKVLSAKEVNDALPFDRYAAELLPESNEGQRIARRLLIDIGETLTGVSIGDATEMRDVFLSQYGRAKAECAKA